MKRIIITAAASAAVLGGGLAVTVPAMASTTPPITAKTDSPLHPDTTSVTGSATQTLPDGNGPVWSYDNLHETITAKPRPPPATGTSPSAWATAATTTASPTRGWRPRGHPTRAASWPARAP